MSSSNCNRIAGTISVCQAPSRSCSPPTHLGSCCLVWRQTSPAASHQTESCGKQPAVHLFANDELTVTRVSIYNNILLIIPTSSSTICCKAPYWELKVSSEILGAQSEQWDTGSTEWAVRYWEHRVSSETEPLQMTPTTAPPPPPPQFHEMLFDLCPPTWTGAHHTLVNERLSGLQVEPLHSSPSLAEYLHPWVYFFTLIFIVIIVLNF